MSTPNQNQPKQKGGSQPAVTPEGTIAAEKLKKDAAVMRAKATLDKALMDAARYNKGVKALDKKIKAGERKITTKVAVTLPMGISALFFIALGLSMGSSHDSYNIYMIPFVVSGILHLPFIGYVHKKKWRGDFFTVLFISMVLGFLAMNAIPYKGMLKSHTVYVPQR